MSNHILRNGLFMGLAFIAVSIVLYFSSKELLVNTSLMMIIGLVIPIYFMWQGAKSTRDEQDGFASFGEMFKVAFFIFIIGTFISNVGGFALRKFDHSLLEMEADAAIEMAENMMDKMSGFMGLDESEQEKMKEEMNNQNAQTKEQILNMGIGSVILNWLGGMIGGAIIALIMGGIMKRTGSS